MRSDCFWLSRQVAAAASAPRSPTISVERRRSAWMVCTCDCSSLQPSGIGAILDHPALLVIARDHAGLLEAGHRFAGQSIQSTASIPCGFSSFRYTACTVKAHRWDGSMAAPDAPWHNAPRASPAALTRHLAGLVALHADLGHQAPRRRGWLPRCSHSVAVFSSTRRSCLARRTNPCPSLEAGMHKTQIIRCPVGYGCSGIPRRIPCAGPPLRPCPPRRRFHASVPHAGPGSPPLSVRYARTTADP